ncbi:hypothetical protein [Trichothermofontia sp.]
MNAISRNTTAKGTLVTLNTWERLLAALLLTGMVVVAANLTEMELQPGWFDAWFSRAATLVAASRG